MRRLFPQAVSLHNFLHRCGWLLSARYCQHYSPIISHHITSQYSIPKIEVVLIYLSTFSYLNIALPDDGSNPTASMVSSLCKTIIVVPSKGIIPIELRLLSSCAMQTSNESTSVQEVLSNLVSMDVRGTQSRRDQDRNILSLGYRLKVIVSIYLMMS